MGESSIDNVVNNAPVFGIDPLLIQSIVEPQRKEIYYGLMNLGKHGNEGYKILQKMNRAEILALCLGIGYKDEEYFRKLHEWFPKGIHSPLLVSKIVSYGFEKNSDFCRLLEIDDAPVGEEPKKNVFSTEKNGLIKRMKSIDSKYMQKARNSMLRGDRFKPTSDEQDAVRHINHTTSLEFYLKHIYLGIRDNYKSTFLLK